MYGSQFAVPIINSGSIKAKAMNRQYYFPACLFLVLFVVGCAQHPIYEVIDSQPQGATILWGKTPSELTDSERQTLSSRYAIGDQWESWCYQAVMAGYLPSKIVCRPDGETERRIAFELQAIRTHITSDPPNAQIYWGRTRDALTQAGRSTPWTEDRVAIGANYKNWYVQVKKAGYRDSEVRFLPQAIRDRNVHFVLEPVEPTN